MPTREDSVMMMSNIVKTYLDDRGIDYQLSSHRHTASSRQTAAAAHVKPHQLAKAVILKCDMDYLMVVVPADMRVDPHLVYEDLGTFYDVASTFNAESLMDDCEPGAIPPIGRAYGVKTLVDDSLDDLSDVYLEAGDHEHLIHVNASNFRKLLSDCRHGHYTRH
jgi:Ala-tRNA(Pro) deacylase